MFETFSFAVGKAEHDRVVEQKFLVEVVTQHHAKGE